MTIYDVTECVGKAYPRAFTSENIQSGFKVTGIYPMNRHIFAEHEFLSSYVTDRPLTEPTPERSSYPSEEQVDEPSTTYPKPSTSAKPNQNEFYISDVNMSATSVLLTPVQIRPYPQQESDIILNVVAGNRVDVEH